VYIETFWKRPENMSLVYCNILQYFNIIMPLTLNDSMLELLQQHLKVFKPNLEHPSHGFNEQRRSSWLDMNVGATRRSIPRDITISLVSS